jgi:hypothetical protein
MQIHNLNIYYWAKFVNIFIGSSNLDDDAIVLVIKKKKIQHSYNRQIPLHICKPQKAYQSN